jgi:hypothetical protein
MSAVPVLTLATLSVANVMLTLAVLARVRSLGRTADATRTGGAPETSTEEPAPPPAGTELAEFTATTVDGETVCAGLLTGETLVGFFATDCSACKELIPRFMDYAEAITGSGAQALAVVSGDLTVAGKLAVLLGTVASVVVEPPQGPVTNAFGVTGYPTVCLLDGRRIAASAFDVSRLPVPAPGAPS